MKNTTIAIDLAKSVFEVGISDRPGHVARNHRLSRSEVSAFLAAQPPATVIMEACSSSHYWGRKFQGFGHDVKLLPPFYGRMSEAEETSKAEIEELFQRAEAVEAAEDYDTEQFVETVEGQMLELVPTEQPSTEREILEVAFDRAVKNLAIDQSEKFKNSTAGHIAGIAVD